MRNKCGSGRVGLPTQRVGSGPEKSDSWSTLVGRVPSNFGDNGDQVYLVPSNFYNRLSFFRWALWENYSASQDLLAKLQERRKEICGKGTFETCMGGAITEDGEGTDEEQEGTDVNPT